MRPGKLFLSVTSRPRNFLPKLIHLLQLITPLLPAGEVIVNLCLIRKRRTQFSTPGFNSENGRQCQAERNLFNCLTEISLAIPLIHLLPCQGFDSRWGCALPSMLLRSGRQFPMLVMDLRHTYRKRWNNCRMANHRWPAVTVGFLILSGDNYCLTWVTVNGYSLLPHSRMNYENVSNCFVEQVR